MTKMNASFYLDKRFGVQFDEKESSVHQEVSMAMRTCKRGRKNFEEEKIGESRAPTCAKMGNRAGDATYYQEIIFTCTLGNRPTMLGDHLC